MMSKRIAAAAVLLVLLTPLPAGAQAPTALVSPGLRPGNVFYIFDTMFEGIGTFFTFGQESKARRYLALAEERLAELQAIVEAEEADRILQALDRYEEKLEKALSTVDQLKSAGEDVEDLATEIAEETLKHVEVLARVYEQVPAAAKAAIQRAMTASSKGHDTAVEAPTDDTEQQQVAEEVADKGKAQIERIQEVRQRGVPIPKTEAEKRLEAGNPPAPAQGRPETAPPAVPPAGVAPGAPPGGAPPAGPPAGVAPGSRPGAEGPAR